MVAVADAVVRECAVVVEALNALVAVVAVPGLLWPQVFALDAEVVKMQRLVKHLLEHSYEVGPAGHVAWIDQS